MVEPAEPSRVDGCIDRRGRHLCMAEQLADGTKIGAFMHEMRGEGVAKKVGGYILCDACLLAQAPQDFVHGTSTERCSTNGEEETR